MGTLARPVGVGLAARGSVSSVVRWAEQARAAGLDSVWFHDSYFERDAVSYASAVAAQVAEIRVAMGAVNPYTRHPVALAMTVSALDEMAPGRVILGLGSGLPLRLAQMSIPYQPDEAITRIDAAITTIRTLTSGERVAVPGLPDLQPMFPPVHRFPIFVAGYRRAMLELAGRVGDGYLARPAESLPAVRKAMARVADAAEAAGRPRDAVETAGYLLSLVDSSRRAALDRAKREPFVIYMLSIQSDVAMARAGFETDLRDRVAAAWRAEDYHRAAGLVPDELVDAFLLCGTRDEVAERADIYREAGMALPLLQPIVQEEEQVQEVLAAAVVYGEAALPAAGAVGVAARESVLAGAGSALGAERRSLGRRSRGLFEISRPFSFTASTVPVAAAGALAGLAGRLSWPLFAASLVASVLLHVGTNVVNEIYDVRKGLDAITSPRASHALVSGRVREREAFALAAVAFALATAIGVGLVVARGWPVVLLGLLGLVGGAGYTMPPLQYKYRALGLPLVFLLMGPLMVVGSYYVITGRLAWPPVVASLPIGLLVTAILHGNEWRDTGEDARAGIRTLSISFGRGFAHLLFVSLIVSAYVVLSLAVAVKALPPLSLLAMLSLPLLVRAVRASELGAGGQQRAIAMIDLETAQLHAAFGALLVAGLAIAAVLR
ncbi:MAG: LLM class flavin-dependent oxidoreductase [Actinomycetota bacterium]|nr:LLM class flavin-dependent oxidoreductase [Actinomycetota bacterium]